VLNKGSSAKTSAYQSAFDGGAVSAAGAASAGGVAGVDVSGGGFGVEK
jgi:hypothetical protein